MERYPAPPTQRAARIADQPKRHVAPRGGIVINGECRTSDESIYAIGECALWNGRIFGLVAPGYRMAKAVAAASAALSAALEVAWAAEDRFNRLLAERGIV